jgi:hypothetical protein
MNNFFSRGGIPGGEPYEANLLFFMYFFIILLWQNICINIGE